jgi:antitoxin (DNA-binding transcriptional repressor) of toxin-antitoxin stability system
MQDVAVRNFRIHLTQYAKRASAGEQIIVRRHGKPIALLRAATEPERLKEISFHRLRASIGRTLRDTKRGRRWLITYYGCPSPVVLIPVPQELLPPDDDNLNEEPHDQRQ